MPDISAAIDHGLKNSVNEDHQISPTTTEVEQHVVIKMYDHEAEMKRKSSKSLKKRAKNYEGYRVQKLSHFGRQSAVDSEAGRHLRFDPDRPQTTAAQMNALTLDYNYGGNATSSTCLSATRLSRGNIAVDAEAVAPEQSGTNVHLNVHAATHQYKSNNGTIAHDFDLTQLPSVEVPESRFTPAFFAGRHWQSVQEENFLSGPDSNHGLSPLVGEVFPLTVSRIETSHLLTPISPPNVADSGSLSPIVAPPGSHEQLRCQQHSPSRLSTLLLSCGCCLAVVDASKGVIHGTLPTAITQLPMRGYTTSQTQMHSAVSVSPQSPFPFDVPMSALSFSSSSPLSPSTNSRFVWDF